MNTVATHVPAATDSGAAFGLRWLATALRSGGLPPVEEAGTRSKLRSGKLEQAPALHRAAPILAWLLIAASAHAGPRTSASYSITTDATSAGGGRVTSASYTNDGNAGDVVGISTVAAPAETAKSGYIGQLYDVVALQLIASPATVNEGLTRQLSVTQVLDDATTLAVPAGVTWEVASGPLVGVDANGLVTAAKVYADTSGIVQGSFQGHTGSLSLTVLNVATDALALGAPLFTVNEETGVVNISVVRTGSTDGAVTVNLSTSSVAATATAGGDYTAVTNVPVVFAHGESLKQVPISILPGNAINEANETFTVNLSTPGLGAVLGGPTTARVRIIDPGDITVPTLPTITTPGTGALVGVNSGGTTNVTGTAADNKGIGSVKVKLNGGLFMDAAITVTGTGTTANYTLPVTSLTGSNTLTVQSFDTRGNPSPTVTRTFKVTRPLAVGFDTTLATLTAGFSPSSFREVGKSLTITATSKTTPAPGAIFTGWTLSGDDVAQGDIDFTPQRLGIATSALEKNTLTFIFREGLVLTANFTANSFAPMAGTYYGLIRPSATLPDRTPLGGAPGTGDGTMRTTATEGFFKATVLNTGAFSGTLTLDGSTLPALSVAGAFDHNGDARFGTARALTFTVARTNKPSLVVALHLDMATPGTGDKITGTVTATDFKRSVTTAVSDVLADKAFYGFQTLSAGIAINSAVVTMGSTLGRFAGEVVTGTGIPANTTVLAVDSPTPNKLTLSANATLTNAAASLTFTRNMPPAYLGAANGNGKFTVVFPAKDVGSQTVGFTTQDYPQGDGYGTITVTKAGVITVAGTLADNTAISMSSALSQANAFPLFVQLYTKQGFLSGMVQLDSTQAASDMAATDLQWLRPFIGTSHYYPYGWPEVIKVDFMGAKYSAVAGQGVMKAPDDGDTDFDGEVLQSAANDAEGDGNVTLTFSDGQLSESLTKHAHLSAGVMMETVLEVPNPDPTFSLSLTRSSGAISGSFTHTDDTVPTFKGTLYQKGPNAGAYGFFLTKQPNPIDYAGESGGVTLIGQP